MNNHPPLDELLPAYALGALDEAEAHQVEAWLHSDPDARQTLAEYQAVAAAILFTTPMHAPAPDLERRLLARRNAPPPTLFTPRPTRWVRWGLVAAAAVVLLALGYMLRPQAEPLPATSTPSRAEVYAAFSTHPQSTAIALVPDAASEAEGEVVYRADTQQVMMRLSHLPPLHEDQAYQLWAIDAEGGYTSLAVYHWYNSGQTTYYVDLNLPQPLPTYQRLGMSLEPLAGSPLVTEPSGPRLLNIPLRVE